MHSTDNLEDGYLGSGTFLWHSIKKHGKENHKREILEYLPSRKSLKKREEEIITEDFIKDNNCMNINSGGGGWDSKEAKKAGLRGHKKQMWLKENDPEWVRKRYEAASSLFKEQFKNGRKRIFFYDWTGRKHKPETIEKMRQSHKGKASGEKNGSFGSKWICNKNTKEVRRCKDEELEELLKIDDWKLGRKIKQ